LLSFSGSQTPSFRRGPSFFTRAIAIILPEPFAYPR
jgi:hypothetical protein